MTAKLEKLLNSNMLVDTSRGTILSKEGEYFPATMLAELKIPGLPKSRAGIYKTATREAWPLIHRPGKGAKDGVKFFLVPQSILDKINEIKPLTTKKPQLDKACVHYGRRADDYRQANLEEFVQVPRYDLHASAGHGSVVHSEQIVDHWAFRSEWIRNALGVSAKDLALISVKGDSMEPTLTSGDMILVDIRNGRIEDNAIYVLQHDGDLLVKRIQRKLDGTVTVISDNKQYDSEVLNRAGAAALRVVGRVVWSGRRM
ncbi:S24 family peptidase [Nitrosospira sp. NpAV]|uniref:S24 family peptidase n=1 Tax=Nitrosospira sp. NpAV TaxID=58133 RepID=UPI000695E024|nr:S24 family peptidase [Nitrosospira sp. NpAV]